MDQFCLTGRRVLLAEDEYMIAADVAEAFGEAGAEVIGPFSTVQQAMAAVEQQPRIDAAVLDVNLGGELAYPLADALSARDVPYLLNTGYDASAIRPRYSKITRREKPIEPADLVKTVASLLESADRPLG